jgi:SagB-type dehydrogenase family enzyme
MTKSDPDISRFWFVQPDDLRTTASMDYHEHSKSSEFLFNFGLPDPKKTDSMMRLIDTVAGKGKDYEYCQSYDLVDKNCSALDRGLGTLLAQRRSRRSFKPDLLPYHILSSLLTRAIGVTGELRTNTGFRPARAYPSGGGLFPLETYVYALSVEGLPVGLYHFNPYGPKLNLLSADQGRDDLRQVFMQDAMIEVASVALVITAVFMRSRFKYAERSYRFIHLEAGHKMQNLILVGQALDISVVPVGGFLDRPIEALLDIDGVEESAIYTALIGKAG